MNKKQIIFIIVITGVLVWVADLLVGNYLAAKLSTSSFARKLNLFNPLAPIVVTNRETVRVNTNNDVVVTAENAKSKISTLIYFDNGKLVSTGSLVNWTNDGYLISTKSAFSATGKVYAIMTQTGEIFPVIKIYPDPASNLVIVETNAEELALLDPADSTDLKVGHQEVLLNNALGNGQTRFATGYLQRLPYDISGLNLNADLVTQNFELNQVAGAVNGSSVVNLSGRLVGIWDGGQVIPVESVRLLFNSFLANQKSITRPSLGFNFQSLSESEAKALQTSKGLRVLSVVAGKSASNAGLKIGDVITKISDKDVNTDLNFDNIFRQLKPGESLKFVIDRGGQTVELNLIVAELK